MNNLANTYGLDELLNTTDYPDVFQIVSSKVLKFTTKTMQILGLLHEKRKNKTRRKKISSVN